jgi:DMSO/TMAO reductase YedYZ heme-binding membrane subunit
LIVGVLAGLAMTNIAKTAFLVRSVGVSAALLGMCHVYSFFVLVLKVRFFQVEVSAVHG